jgi:hypothetical protein
MEEAEIKLVSFLESDAFDTIKCYVLTCLKSYVCWHQEVRRHCKCSRTASSEIYVNRHMRE